VRGLSALAASALVALVAASPASADPYVALGDSVGAGTGASAPSNRYVNLLYGDYQAQLGADQLLNRSVGGATSGSLISGGQLSTALADINAPSDTKAVTIDIGGNDALTMQCTSNWDDPSACHFRANLASILSQLKAALGADPGSESFTAMAYYNPGVGTANEAAYDQALLGTNLAINCTDTGADVGLNDVIYQEAARLEIAVADPSAAFKANGQAYMADAVHPNDPGHLAVAEAFRSAAVPPTCAGPGPDPDPPDTIAPETVITKHPPHRTKRARVKYRFASSEAGSSFECRLDGADYAPCGSPIKLRHLEPGRHTFRVRATDAARNTDQTPARDRFKVVGSG
jgi:lysophospholipase L1-like esterase